MSIGSARRSATAGRRDRGIRPVRRILGPLSDPPLERVLLRVGERLVRLRRRHPVGFGSVNAVDQLALVGLAGDDRFLLDGHGPVIEPQTGLALLRIGPVAEEALVRKDRPDVAVEVDGIGGAGRSTGENSGEAEEHSTPARRPQHCESSDTGGARQVGSHYLRDRYPPKGSEKVRDRNPKARYHRHHSLAEVRHALRPSGATRHFHHR